MSDIEKPRAYVSWAHLNKKDFVIMKKEYVKYWRRFLLNGNYANVFSELVYHVNYETGACFPSRALIASRIGKSEKTVQRAIKALEDHGLIDVRRLKDLPRSDDGFLAIGGGRSNLYTISFDCCMVKDEMGRPVMGEDEKLVFLTLGGRRRLPASHMWYDIDEISDAAKLPPLDPPAPPGPSSDADVPALSPSDDLAVSSECLAKAKEGFQGYEGKEGKEGTDVTPAAIAAGGASGVCTPLTYVTRGTEDLPALSENKILSDVDASQETKSALSDYLLPPVTALEKMRDEERQQMEDVARHEDSVKWRESLRRTARLPPRLEISLLEEEVLLVD